MRSKMPSKLSLFILLMITATAFSCSQKPIIRVDYLMNPAGDTLAAKKIAIRVVDERKSRETLSSAAKKKCKAFTGYFSLALSGSEAPVGIYEPAALFHAAMKSKMENVGMEVLEREEEGVPVVEIGIKEFFIDIADFKWQLALSIDVRLWKGTMITTEQSVNGQAERVRFPRDLRPDNILGEIFTDVMARIDLESLLDKGGY